MKYNLGKKHKGFGLIEVLIAIVIFGTTFIMATSVTIKSLRRIKDNELTDLANSIMIRSLEFSKSSAISTTTLQGTGNAPWSFYITGDVSNINTNLTEASLLQATGDTNKISVCDEGSRYKVAFTNINSLFLLCNQILVEKLPSNNLQITVRVIYSLSDGFYFSELKGFRKLDGI